MCLGVEGYASQHRVSGVYEALGLTKQRQEKGVVYSPYIYLRLID